MPPSGVFTSSTRAVVGVAPAPLPTGSPVARRRLITRMLRLIRRIVSALPSVSPTTRAPDAPRWKLDTRSLHALDIDPEGLTGWKVSRTRLSSRALTVTVTVEALMASAAHSGRRSRRVHGYSAPPAMGMAITL